MTIRLNEPKTWAIVEESTGKIIEYSRTFMYANNQQKKLDNKYYGKLLVMKTRQVEDYKERLSSVTHTG